MRNETTSVIDEQHHRQRRAVAEIQLGERGAVGVEVEDLGRRAGAAAGRGEDRGERRERDHHAQDDDDHDRRPDQRQRDVDEALPRAGAVDARGLVDVGRQRGEAGEDHQERERRPLPGVDRDHRDQRELRVAEPVVAAEAERARDEVDEAEVGRQHQRAPEQADDDRREHDRQDRRDPQRRLARAGSAAPAARARGRSRPAARPCRRVDRGEPQRDARSAGRAHLRVVVEPGEAGQPRHRQVDALQAGPRPGRPAGTVVVSDQHERSAGRNSAKRERALAPAAPASRPIPASGRAPLPAIRRAMHPLSPS